MNSCPVHRKVILTGLLVISAGLLCAGQAQAVAPVFSRLLGGGGPDQVRDIVAAGDGSVYVTGGSGSADFPVQANASGFVFDGTHNGSFDAYAAKFAADGTLVWSTFLGGPGYDRAYAADLDEDGNLVIAGRAGAGFPVTAGVVQSQFEGGRVNPGDPYFEQDGFVCKIDPDGRVIFCSYFGADDGRIIRDVVAVPGGDICISAGHFNGVYTPFVAAAFVNGPAGDTDIVAARLSGDGATLRWARYLGGSQSEPGTGSVGTDGGGNCYLGFGTFSPGLATAGAYDVSYAGGEDLLAVKLDPQGALVWATYLGGDGSEFTETHHLDVTTDGRVHIAASTTSTPAAIPDSAQTVRRLYGSLSGPRQVLFARLSSGGDRLEALTLLGGNGSDFAEGMAASDSGEVFCVGQTQSSDFPYTGAAPTGPPPGVRALAIKLNADFSLAFATTLGGSGDDYGRAADFGPGGTLVLGGQTTSPDWPQSGPQGQAYAGGAYDGVLVRLAPPASLCGAQPDPGCPAAGPGGARISIADRPGQSRDKLDWKWRKGAAIATEDFMQPGSAAAALSLCLYDASGASAALAEFAVPTGGMCGKRACWKSTGDKGFRMRDRAASSGITSVTLRSGAAGKAKIGLKGRGGNLALPPLPLIVPLRVQFVAEDGGQRRCWEGVLSDPSKNDAEAFRAKGP